jgi:hypothetical protein
MFTACWLARGGHRFVPEPRSPPKPVTSIHEPLTFPIYLTEAVDNFTIVRLNRAQ